MALIAMCVYSTPENNKDKYLEKCLQSLKDTVDFTKHRLQLSVNGFTEKTKEILNKFSDIIEKIHWNKENLGTSEGLNLIIKERKSNEPVIKTDDDVLWHQKHWVEEMEEVIKKDPNTAIVGLKRFDLDQNPDSTNPYFKTTLIMFPHIKGEPYIVVEKSKDIMGTCTLFTPQFLDKVGFSRQPTKYGFEDNLFAALGLMLGFSNYFIPHIRISHIDEGGGDYWDFKQKESSAGWPLYQKLVKEYKSGERNIYYNPFEND